MVSEAALRIGPLRHGSDAVLPNRRVRQFPMPRQASVHELTQPGDWWLSVLVSQERAMKLRFACYVYNPLAKAFLCEHPELRVAEATEPRSSAPRASYWSLAM